MESVFESFLRGSIAGFLLAVVTVPATIWIAQLGLSKDWRSASLAGQALIFSHCVAAAVILAGFLALDRFQAADPFLRLFSGLVFAYVALKQFRAPRADRLRVARLPASYWKVFRHTFVHSLFMPMRVPLIIAVLVTLGFARFPQFATPGLFGFLAGLLVWWFGIIAIGLSAGRHVPESVTLQSLNKLGPFAGFILLALDFVVLFPLLNYLP